MNRSASLSIFILGDICATEDTRVIFDGGEPTALLGGLVEKIRSADISIANLECVLTDTAQPADKIGPVLTGLPEDAAVLAAAGFTLLGIANNHIKDCGETGVLDTIAACEKAGLLTTGGGRNASTAAEPTRIEINGWTIGVMAVAEHEFNAASTNEAGAHVFDPLVDLERLRKLSDECDYTIVLYHGGIEYHPFPSPLLQHTCRSLVRNGADLVLCQHSHVIGSSETYNNGYILYGQGNSVFGYRPGKPSWNEGLAVSVTLERATTTRAYTELLPIGCDSRGRVDILKADKAGSCLSVLKERSRLAEDPNWIETAWRQFCVKQGKNHLPHVLGWGLWPTRINRVLKGRLVRSLFTRRQRMTVMNVVRCDAHREVILTAFEQTLATPQKQDSSRP